MGSATSCMGGKPPGTYQAKVYPLKESQIEESTKEKQATKQAEPAAKPKPALKTVHFDRVKLRHLEQQIQRDIDGSKFPGASLLIKSLDGVVLNSHMGYKDSAKPNVPDNLIDDNTIFRLYSMTKPIISLAIMILRERRLLKLDDDIAKWIPCFKQSKLRVYKPGNLSLEAPQKPISVHHLLTHTSGIAYVSTAPKELEPLYKAAKMGIETDEFLWSLDEVVQKLSLLPLASEPGTEFRYGLSTDVLGHLIERVSGKPLNVFLRENIFMPLKMETARFYYYGSLRTYFENHLAQPAFTEPQFHNPLIEKPLFSGGGGLCCTTRDYTHFLTLFLNRGMFRGQRIVTAKTIALMLQPQLIAEGVKTADGFGWIADYYYPSKAKTMPNPLSLCNFSLGGFVVDVADEDLSGPSTNRIYSYGGWGGTYFYVDPANNYFVIFMSQCGTDPESKLVHYRTQVIKKGVEEAIIRSPARQHYPIHPYPGSSKTT